MFWWVAVALCRLLLASSLIFSGAVKLIDPRGTEYKIQDYAQAFGLDGLMLGLYLPLLLSMALAITEFCLGINLLFGSNRRWTARMVFGGLLLFTPLTLYLAIANPISDCGCFGDALVLSHWQSFGKNVVLLLSAFVLCHRHRLHFRLISEHNQWIVTQYSWLFAFLLSLYCVYTLPVIDFRPYHIGADLAKQMQWDEDSDTPPPLVDLVILDTDSGEELTDSIILGRGWKFLIISPKLEYADDGIMDKLAELHDYCNQYGYMLAALTASSDSLIDYWRDITGAEYPFLHVDEIPLKTMVRSNPGLLLLKDSRVSGKWASSQMPGAAQLVAPLEELDWANRTETTYMQRLLILLLWYAVPLGTLSMLDRLWLGVKLFRNRKKDYKNILKTKEMRKHIVAGNWKMNKTLQEGVALATELKDMMAAEKPNCEVIIGTPFIHLATVSELLKDSVVAVSAENCANKESGAYTGEVSAAMVKSTGAEYVILGHSERREYYHETPEILKEKVDLALANGLKVIFCIGESLAEREANEQEAVCKAELAGSVFHLSAEQWKNIVIAYEPIWAIGTGKTATAEQAEEIHAFIRSCVAEVYGKEVADETSILYGGSCKASNAPELFGKPDIDGGLIGGASLKAADFKGIIDAWKA